MYDSKNLPLSKKKIIKRSLQPAIFFLFFSIIAGGGIFLATWSESGGLGKPLLYGFITALIIVIVFIGPAVLYQYLYYKFYYYNFQDDTAEIKKGVISIATGHVRYSKIQNIFVDQDLLDRIFGLYDVHYETAGEHSGFYSHVDGLNKENSDKLVTFLNQRVQNKDTSTGQPSIPLQTPQQPIVNQQSTDSRTFSRENLPVEKRLVSMMVWSKFSPQLIGIVYIYFLITSETYKTDTGKFALFSLFTIFIAIPILTMIGNYIYFKIWYKNYKFTFDATRGVISTKVIASNEKHLYYNRIQNINVTQGIIERFFGLWSLTIETASEGIKKSTLSVVGLTKANAEILKEFLLTKSSSHQQL